MSYTPPEVWTWTPGNGGQFANINKPTAGASHDKALPVGQHPFQLYSLATPNGVKVTIMLEELVEAGLLPDYDAWLIQISGDQFGSGFVGVNPNSKIPAMMDYSGDTPVRLFESGSILIHLAEKFGAFLPGKGPERTETLNWLMWQMGSAPFVGGGFGHFYAYAPEKYEYPINRYAMETKRQLDVLDRRLAEVPYVAGQNYSIADMATWPWVRVRWLHKIDLDQFPHVSRWYRTIEARPAVQRGLAVLAKREKIGNPDERAREALFGTTQLKQGRGVSRG